MSKIIYSNLQVRCNSSNQIGLISSVCDDKFDVDFGNGNKKKFSGETAFEKHYLEYVDKGYQKQVEDYFKKEKQKDVINKIRQEQEMFKRKEMLDKIRKEKEEEREKLENEKLELQNEKRKRKNIKEKERQYTDRLGIHDNKHNYFKMMIDFKSMDNIEKLFVPTDKIVSNKETILMNDNSIVFITKYNTNEKNGINKRFNVKEINGNEYKEYCYKTVNNTIKEFNKKRINDKKIYLIVWVTDNIKYNNKIYKKRDYFYYEGEVIDVKFNKYYQYVFNKLYCYNYFFLTLKNDEDNKNTIKTLCNKKNIKFEYFCCSK